MLAYNPDLEPITTVFHNLATLFPQYVNSREVLLCPSCISEWITDGKRSDDKVGTYQQGSQFCSELIHPIRDSRLSSSQSVAQKCWSHNQIFHDFFVNYRVETEGHRISPDEPVGGLVQIIYENLARQKTSDGLPIYVFWDKKCLCPGQDWEEGFLHGLTHSKVIVLLISLKVLKGIHKKASQGQQDNVLIEYECALIENQVNGTPVLPVFLGEVDETSESQKYAPFHFAEATALELPDTPHQRNSDAQSEIDTISHSLLPEKKKFLDSISKTIQKIFKLQGYFLPLRGDDQDEIDKMVNTLMQILEKH